MGELSAKDLLKRHDVASTDRERWRHLYRDAYRYTQAARDTIDRPQKGQRRHDVIFDSTGARSHAKLSNRLQDLIFPSGKNFVELRPGPAFDQADETARKQVGLQLHQMNESFHASIWKSNFEIAIGEYLQDKIIGMGAMLFNEGPDWDPFHFAATPQFNLSFGEGPWGTIGAVSREDKLLPSAAAKQWPDNVIAEADKKLDSENDGRVYVEMTYPDDDSAVPGGAVGMIPTRWFYAVIDQSTKRHILAKQRVIETASHWIVSRWSKAAGEVRGRGPVLAAMPDIRTANKVVELILKNGSLAVSGLWTGVDDGVFNPNTSSFAAGSVIVVGANAGPRGPTLKPLEFPGNFDVSQLILDNLQSAIKQALLDADLPPVAGPPRTATEFIQRLRELFVDIGPAAGRVNKELIGPLVLRGLHILRRKGIIEIPADMQLDSQFIDIQMVSPLARRQNLENVEKVMQALEMSSFLGPELLQLNFKVEDIPRYIAEELGVVESLIRSPEEKEEIKQTLVDTAQAQAQAAQAAAERQQREQPRASQRASQSSTIGRAA